MTERSETVADLAQLIGLEPDEYTQWLEPVAAWTRGTTTVLGRKIPIPVKTPGRMPSSASQVLNPCEVFQIPNTVLAYWDGNFGDFGEWWVMWASDVATLKKRGFMVDENRGWVSHTWNSFLMDKTLAKELHGIFYWGHGVPERSFPSWDPLGFVTGRIMKWEGPTLQNAQGNPSEWTKYRDWKLQYHLALGALWACGTDPRAREFFAYRGQHPAVFAGFQGVGIPHGLHQFGPSVELLLPPGAQETRK